MKLSLKAALAASALAFAIPAAAHAAWPTDWNASVGYGVHDISNGGPSLGAITGRIGFHTKYYLGAEVEASTGAHQDSIGLTKYNLSTDFAGYVTATAPLSPAFDIFVRGGYGKISVKQLPTAKYGFNSWNYGVGADWYPVENKTGLRVDYTRQDFNSSSTTANVYALSIVHKF